MNMKHIESFQQYLDMVIGYLDCERTIYNHGTDERRFVEGQLHCAYKLRTIYKSMKEKGQA